MVIYIVSDGKKGHLTQTRGLAQAIIARAQKIRPNQEHSVHEVNITHKSWLSKLFYKGRDLDLPKPNLILCAGHGTHFAALSLSRNMRSRCVVCMRPSLPPSMFDLCVAPRHDFPDSENLPQNIFLTNGAINTVHPRPDVEKKETLVLIGGPSKGFQWESEMILNQLATIAKESSNPIVLTTSRRTPEDFDKDVLATCPSIRVEPFGTTGPTWVEDHLATAREVWVTQDSVSMVYEALSSGAPVGILEMPKRHFKKEQPSRVIRGLGMLIDEGAACTFTEWANTHKLPVPEKTLDEAGRTADYILETFPDILP